MRKYVYAWYPMLLSMSMGFGFLNIPPLSRQFMSLLGVGYDGLSLVLSGLLWAHALAQLPAGVIADRLGAWSTIMAGLAISLMANLLPFLDPRSLPLAVAMRFLAGAGASLAVLGVMKVIYVLTPNHQLTRVQGLQGAGFSLGMVLPYLILPYLGEDAWPYSYLGAAFFVLLPLAGAFLLPRAELRAPAAVKSTAEPGRALKEIVRSPAIWALGLMHGLSYGTLNNLGNWLPSILADLDGVGDPKAWSMATMLLLFVATFSRALANQIFYRAPKSRMVNVSVLAIVLMYLLMGLSGHSWLVLGAALLMALATGTSYGGLFTLTGKAFGAVYAATAIGVMSTIANIGNVGITLLLGYVRQYSGSFSLSLLILGALGGLFWLWGQGAVRRLDQREE